MNDIGKFIHRLDRKEREKALETIELIENGKFDSLDIKKLKGAKNKYRVRKGKLRIMYEMENNGSFHVIEVTRRGDNTYNF